METHHTASDRRLKDNIKTIPNALDKVLKLRGVQFQWKDKSKPQRQRMGYIAQEVEKVLPDQVNTSENTGLKSVEYEQMIGLLTEAIKEQQKQIEKLEARIDKLEEK